jgi:hypothetical protein
MKRLSIALLSCTVFTLVVKKERKPKVIYDDTIKGKEYLR